MKDEFVQKLAMYGRVKDYLQNPANKSRWFNKKPKAFTTLEGQFETEAGNVGAFGDAQSQTLTGVTDQQNTAELALEDTAALLARALRLLLIKQNNLADAAKWEMTLTDWRKLQEQVLLERARTLLAALLPQTTGTPPAGEDYGITTDATDLLSDRIDAYAAVIGAPGSARSTKKAQTGSLRSRFQVPDETLAGMDDLAPQFTVNPDGTPNADGKLFVDGYFNARRIGGNSSGPAPTPTPPPAPSP
ncbi:MAG: hypothetical protein HY300_17170 [Verrucomicrobia bacterium]|nr:hypothetical protein [Verrucomicrobiota bacterium]